MSSSIVSKCETYYNIIGEGSPIVLIPGLAADHKSWRFQINELKRYYKVISVDNRGLGKSGICNDSPLKEMVNNIHNLVDLLNLDRIHLLGHSMGAIIAFEYACFHPEKVSSLILSSLPISDFNGIPENLDKLYSTIERGEKENFYTMFIPQLFSADFLNSKQYDIIEYFISQSYKRNPIKNILLQLIVLKEWKKQKRWEQGHTKRPCILIYGAEDKFATVDQGFLSRILPYASFKVIMDAGHAVHIEKPKEFNKIVHDFIEGQQKTQ